MRLIFAAAFLALSAAANAASISWTGGPTGDWNVAGNWSTDSVPGPGDDATIPGPAFVTAYAGAAAPSVNSLTLQTGGVLQTFTGVLAVGAVSLQTGSALQFGATAPFLVGTFALAAGSSATYNGPPVQTGTVPPLHLQAQLFSVAAGATVTVLGGGYAPGAASPGFGPGLGGGDASGAGGGGGGAAGAGGTGSGEVNGGSAYGFMPPADGGSGGGGTSSAVGGAGGGFLIVDATTATLDGLLQADGAPGVSLGTSGAGGGGGGSILLRAQVLTGSGVVSAAGGSGGTGASTGGGGGGGGRAWLQESGPFAVLQATLTVTTGGGAGGGGAGLGTAGGAGAAFVDPRHWTALGPDQLASDPANWNDGLAPSGGERVVFGSSETLKGCSWDAGMTGVVVGSMSVTTAFSTSVTLGVPMVVSGGFAMAGGTFTAVPGLSLTVGGALHQTGGRLDVGGSILALTASVGSVPACFYDARASSLTIGGGVVAATVTFSGLLEVQNEATLSALATLSLSTGTLSFDDNGPFNGSGSVNAASTSSVIDALGASTQTWTAWPGVIGGLRSSNQSYGGLTLDLTGGTRFVMEGGVFVDTFSVFKAPGARLDVGGDWASYGTTSLSGSTVSFRAASGTQSVYAGGGFDNLVVNDAGAALAMDSYVTVVDSVVVLSGTLELAASTVTVGGDWTEAPGATVLGGVGVTAFNGAGPQYVYQLGGNSFGSFTAASAAGVTISSTLATTAAFLWQSGSLSFPGVKLLIGGDMRATGGSGLNVAGSTVVFDGSSTQTVTFAQLADFVDANTSPAGVRLGANISVGSFHARNAVIDGQNAALTVTGSTWDTAGATYYAQNPAHTVLWAPSSSSIWIASGSVVDAQLSLGAGMTAVLKGDLNMEGTGTVFNPMTDSTVVAPPGGSTIAFRGTSDLAPSAGPNWFYTGDVADSWLVYEGASAGRGASISTTTFGTLRVTLNTGADVFRATNMTLSDRFILESGTVRPASPITISVGGDVVQTGGVIDFGTVSTGTLLLSGPSTQTVSLLWGAHTLWNLTDASTAAVQAASSMTIRGDFVIAAGTFSAGSGVLDVSGRVFVSSAGVFAGQTGVVTLNGAANGVTAQTVAVYGGAAFNGLTANVQTATLLTSATAATFTDAFPGGTLAVSPGAQLTAGSLFLGPASGADLTVQSVVPGSPWYLRVTALSSATLTTASDSNASPGLPIAANDGHCVNAGGDVNWNFNPLLLVLLPGEVFTPGVAPGKSGVPQVSTAGVSVTATVMAMSSNYVAATAATGTVTLASDDAFALTGGAQLLVNGATAFAFTPFAAEPSPRATHVTASVFFGAGVSTASVIPAGLTGLQIVMPGESPNPGSPTGKGGAPYPRAKGIPFSMTVRAVDPFWNLIATVTDSAAFGVSTSTASLPGPQALAAGQLTASPIILYATGTFTLSATDLTEPQVLSSTSTPFPVTPPSLSSPTAAFYVPTGASVSTLGGAIAGTAADGASVARVRVGVLDVESNLYYDSGPQTFSSPSLLLTTTTLASPLAASTSWSNPVPDAALTNGNHYAATALVDDPTGFESVIGSTFVVDRSALTFGSGNGQGWASVLPSTAAGCETRIATVTFTVGGSGITAGGAVALLAPAGWTAPLGVSASYPPPAGFWNVASTSLAMAPSVSTAVVGLASYGAQILGPGWLVLSVATKTAGGFQPGENIVFTYTGMPPLSPAGRGAQTFAVWSQSNGGGALAAISTQPALSLMPGTTSELAFSDPTPLSLGPLQASSTMELSVVDLCGNPTPGASSGTVTLSLVVPESGVYVPDATAQFRNISGSTISYVSLTTGTALTIGFTVATATSGPTLAYIQALSSFTAVTSSAVVASALRAVRLTASSETFTAVSVDTGTLSPGTTSAALSAAVPGAYPGRLVFTLGDPAAAWTAALSLDAVNFTTPTFLASGAGSATGPIALTWDGVDRVSSPPRFAAPGHYHARLSAGGGATLNQTLEIVVPPTAGYTGNLGASGASAFVRAIGPGAGDGAFSQASATGYFLVTGLNAGQAYQVTVATAATLGVLPVVLSTALAAPPAAAPVVNLGALALPVPALMSVAAILPVPAPFDEVGGFVGISSGGAVAFSGTLHFSTGAASSDNGGPLFGQAASTWSAVLAAPGVYTLELELPDLNLSTAVAGVTLAPGGTQIIVPFSKSANVYGWAILPSTAPGGTSVAVAATKAGAASPGAFGSVFVSSVPPAVGPSSGAYALYGLTPGSWTLTASGPGFLSTSAVIVVLSSADVAGPNLPLGVGGAIVGTVTVSGNSLGATQCFAGAGGAPGVCAPGTFDLPLTAQSVDSLGAASAEATLTGSATSASATFTITGLPPGRWTVSSSLPGFSLTPAGGLVVSVAGASVSTSALTLTALDARLSLTVLLAPLPGGACRTATAWKSLGLEFDGADGAARTFGDATALTGSGSFESLGCSSAMFFTPALPPGPTRAAALFATTGSWAYGRALLASGATASLTLDLSASSAAATGALSVSGLLSIATTTASGAPFTVLASSPPGILSAAAGVSYCLLGGANPASSEALVAELIPYDPLAGEPSLRPAPGGAGSCAALAASTATATSLAFTAPVTPSGSFAFSPGVAPGTYLFRVPGELDGNPADGPEAVEFDQLVTIGASGVVLAPTLGRGSGVSGVLTAPASLPSGRLFQVSLIGPGGAAVQSASLAPPPGGSAPFAFNGVAAGIYVLTATDLGAPASFAAPALAVTVAGAAVSGRTLSLGASGTIYAHLAAVQSLPGGAQQSVLITAQNAGLLPQGFTATAVADPAAPGAVYSSLPAANGALVDSSGRLTIAGLAPGTYDVQFAAPSSTAAPSAGALSLSPAMVSGVSVGAGQAVDVGVVPLLAGSYIAGQITSAVTGLPVANLTVSALPSASGGASATDAPLTATTDASGRYLLRGLDPTQSLYDVTAAPRGSLASGQPLAPYAAQRALSVSVSSGATVNFALDPANSTVTGRIVAPNGTALMGALPGGAPAPGAVVFLQTVGLAPTQDPFANLALQTNPDGTFSIPSVATGSYQLTASALGQGSALVGVVVVSSTTNLGVVTLGSGGVVSGAVRLPDGTSPPASQVLSMAAIAPDSSAFLFAALTYDPTGATVVGYSVGGITPGKTYRLVVSGPGGVAYVPPEASALVLTSSSAVLTANLTLRPPAGPIQFRASRGTSGFNLTTIFPQPLRALTGADSNGALLLTTAPAAGTLSVGTLASDRLTLTATYAPGLGETTATFLASATLAGTNWSSTNPGAAQLTVSATTSLQVVGDGLTTQTVFNGLGGTLTLDGDPGRVVLPRGAFNVDAATSVAIAFSHSSSPAAYAALAPPLPAASDLYNVALPPGVPTSLTQAAPLTLAYSTTTNPSSLNLYWYDAPAQTYVLQPDVLGGAPVVDLVAHTVTVRVNHFSTYVLLNSGAGAIGGAATAVASLTAYNFPNPFDLSYKTVTTIHGGGAPTIRGTMISVSVPPGLSGEGTAKIFDITGRLLRTIDMGAFTGGQVYYQNWDGRNDFGRDVASGVYLCEIDVGSQRRIFKMAVLK